MSRGHTVRCVCSHPGCKETSFYHYDTLRDAREGSASKQQRAGTWLCTRHTAPNEVLSDANPTTTHVLVCVQLEYGRFWQEEGKERVGSGFTFGDGYKAYAKDFPPGTRLTITAQLTPPCPHP